MRGVRTVAAYRRFALVAHQEEPIRGFGVPVFGATQRTQLVNDVVVSVNFDVCLLIVHNSSFKSVF